MCKNLCPMKFKFLYLFAALIAKTVFADEAPCGITSPKDEPEITWSGNKGRYMRKAILMDSATLNIELPYQGTIENLNSSPDGTLYKYINAQVNSDKNQIEITTNEHFAQFDEDTEKQKNNPLSTLLILNFKCENQDTYLEIYINVEDTNNNDPEFEKSSYVYTLPMPMIPKYDLTSLGEPIYASDVDFSNQDVTFTIDPVQHFLLETVSLGDKSKQYRAKLTVSEYSRLPQDTDFTLTVTDSGTPPRTKTTQITIKVDDSSSEPDKPTFSKPSYTFKYSIQNEKPVITTDDGPIAITTSDPNDLTVDFKDAQKYFQAEYNPEKKEVTITSTGTPVDTTEHVMVLTLKVTSKTNSDVNSATIILVDIPEENVIAVPVFSKPYYMANYSIGSDKDTVALEEEITVSPTESVEISLTGDKNSNFDITKVDGKWQIGVQTNLNADDLKKGGDIILTLKASVTGADAGKVDDGFATLVIQLPVVTPAEPPKFGQPHYSADYQISKSGTDTLKLNDEPITVTASEDVTVTFESTYKDYFDLQANPQDTSTYTISVKQDLTSAILNKEAEILIILKATSSKEVDPGISTVIISLPKDIAPKFSKPSYKAQYEIDTNGNGKISTEEIIQISTIAKQTVTVTIKNEEYQKYFGIVPDSENSNNYKLSLKENLPEEILQTHEDIVLTLQADLADTVEGLSTFVISLPQAIIPTFSKSHYSAAYEIGSDGNGKVTVNDGPIEITSPTDRKVTVVIVEADYKNYFNVEEDTNGYKLSVIGNLPDDIVAKSNIVLTLQATADNSDSGITTVVITMIKAEVPKFSKSHYTAKYEVDTDGNGLVTVSDGPINVISPVDQSITVTIAEQEYTTYFAIELDSGSNYKVTVKTKLTDDILKTEEIALTLQATTTGSAVDPGVCTLVIVLPKTVSPTFLKAYYNADYKVVSDQQATVEVKDGPIQISLDEEVTVTIEGTYAAYFAIDLGSDPQVTVKKNLETDIINQHQEIILTVQASPAKSPDNKFSTVIALQLPYVPNPDTLKFEKPSYIFAYKIENDIPSIDQKGQTIKLTNGIADAQIAVKGTHGNNFEMQSNDDGTYSLAIKTPLEQKFIISELDTILTLDASLEGDNDGFATILLNLPRKELPTPNFIQSSFVAEYVIGEDSDSVTMIGSNITLQIGIDAYNPTVIISSGTNSDHFNITYNTNKEIYELSVKDNLDDETLIKEADIVLTLQATIEGTPAVGTATLIIKLPKKVAPPSFSLPFYDATYVPSTSGGKDVIQLNNDETITLEGDNIPETTVSFDAGEYTDNFKISSTAPYTLSVETNIEQTVLYTKDEIIVTLTAALKDSTLTSKASVKIALPGVPVTPKFSTAFYTAKYDDKAATVTVEGEKISTDAQDPSLAIITVESPYDSNFKLEYNKDTKAYDVNVIAPLDSTTVDRETQIIVILEVTTTYAVDKATATLLITMPEKITDVVPEFSEISYVAVYAVVDNGLDTVVISSARPIKITSDHETDTVVKVTGNYESNFDTQKGSDGSWQIVVKGDLDEKTLKENKEIVVTLEASLTGNEKVGRAAVILGLPDRNLKPTPTFSKTYYTANYTVDAQGAASLALTEPILITSKANLDLISVTFTPYDKNFQINRDDTNIAQWNMALTDPLDQAIVDANTEITITLTATLDDSVGDGTATLIIKLPLKEIVTVSFDKSYYKGTYTHNDKSDTITNDAITVQPSDATVTVDGDYKSNFAIECKAGKCTLKVTKGLSSDILSSETRITIAIKATHADAVDTGAAAVIIDLPLLNVKPAPTFTKTYYTVLYEVDDSSTPSLNLIDGPIKINSEFEDSVEVNLQSYSENFGIKRDPATAEWTLTLKKPLDDQTLIDNREIAVELKAHLDQAAADASATLLFKLPEKAVIQFVKPYYTANYTIHTDADDTVESEEITVNVKDVTVTIKSDEEFKENFEIKKANEKYSLVVVKKLGDDVLENKKEILLVLEASKTGINEKGATTVIIKLPLQDENITPEFSKDVYTASYINDATASVKLDSKITVENVDPTKVSITIEGGYSDNFAPVFETNQWKLNVIKPLAEETLSQDVSILLRLQAKAENIVTPGKAAVVIKLPKQVTPTSIVFSNNVYMAHYDEDNKNVTVEEEITIEGDPAGNAIVTLDNNENAKYFSLSYKDGKVSITLKQELSDAVIKEQAAISVDIIAKNSKDTIKATLVVKLPHTTSDGDDDCSSDDKSGLIAAIAVLAVLLVAAIVGSAVFYYVKFRRVSAYDNMDDPTSHSERFKRNSNTGTKNKFEHPTRRPTGVIKYPINNDDPGETTTEEEFPEKRKSVQFDTINIDELEIEPEKPEDDDMYENVFENAKGVSDGEDDRNSSES